MPELPEVETVVRDLRAAVVGRRVVGVELLRDSIVRYPDGAAFRKLLLGAFLANVERRGKFIHLGLGSDGGTALIVHLGMTGHLDVVGRRASLRPHTHLRCRLDDGRELRFADARRFGRVLLGPPDWLRSSGVLPPLGVEPLSADFTPAALDAVLRSTRRTLKAALLDQRGVAGLGNIYVDEACFVARVRPQRRCQRLTRAERARLHAAIVTVLERAVANRGTSIEDFRDIWDAPGNNQEELRVYGRAEQPCLRCATPLRHAVVAGRGTTWCPSCQR
ncbi:MAG TPA: bifunctional DNA-formamidopyrimidine glycosylase/DNA-(apurinic or apyrimidinic site) lyase [Candidatus Dormibacteraeota bacterium]